MLAPETGQKGDDLSFTINRTDVVESQVRQAITPEVIALSVLGAHRGGRDAGAGRPGRHRAGRGRRDRAVPAGAGGPGPPLRLISHPAQYGWNWDTVIQAEAGYGSFNPGVMGKLLAGQQAVGAWSEFAFTQLPVDGKFVPVLGVRRDLGSIQPPTTAGRPLAGGNQIELGTVTLAALGKKIGDTVRIGIAPYTRTAVITGTVTLPSFGIGAAEHVSLGRGAMLPEATLLAVTGATVPPASANQSIPAFPSAVAIDWAPGSTTAQRAALIHRVTLANPDGTPGGTYELPSALASAIVNTEQMGGQPLALGIGLAALVLAGNLLAALPTAVAARTRPAVELRAE